MMVDVSLPGFILLEGVHVPEDYRCVFGTSNSNIQPFSILKKTDFAVIISSNTAKDNNIYFLPLESIHCAHPNIFISSHSPKLFLNS